jgi:hypothetical protein
MEIGRDQSLHDVTNQIYKIEDRTDFSSLVSPPVAFAGLYSGSVLTLVPKPASSVQVFFLISLMKRRMRAAFAPTSLRPTRDFDRMSR